MILKTVLAISLIFNILAYPEGEYVPSAPEIIKVYTGIPEEGNWVRVPKGTEELTIHVKAINTETVLFWLIPTGTQTWSERKLIGYDIQNGKDNKFSITWKVPKQLHDHLKVQALGENGIVSSTLNITLAP